MKKLKVYCFILCMILILLGGIGANMIFEVPKTSKLASGDNNVRCLDYKPTASIDVSEPLHIGVWNIYKQRLDGWKHELLTLSQKASLILLQEAQSSSNLSDFVAVHGWHSNQAFAFAMNGKITGVMTLSDLVPQRVCAYTIIEPYLRLPKSALYSEFLLSNGRILTVINIHSINFTFGIEEYLEQLRALIEAVKVLQGPLIIAGDFNTWSELRLQTIKTELNTIGLQEASFSPDIRLKFFGLPLDHVFYRGLILERASSKETESSDHNMIVATFSFNNK
ncbi:endonuclease/exonuclease/phosphatase family protein [Candidatus Enterovibrio escicola]|uniref:endonuclease/exonuclease/phosphatase family protein n=1 Tax=Candidatus Enterovibrio escicola TaxID=1927127 RepID=UPI0012380AE4|nr:endonuclease/exonuclease/phosphatase family protein [Candidatus Enterovibrio escacola]